MSTVQLRKEIKKVVDRLPPERLESLAEGAIGCLKSFFRPNGGPADGEKTGTVLLAVGASIANRREVYE